MTGALDQVLKELCGSDYNGMCPAFTQSNDLMEVMLQKLKDISFTIGNREFKFHDGQYLPGYVIYRLNGGTTQKVIIHALNALVFSILCMNHY